MAVEAVATHVDAGEGSVEASDAPAERPEDGEHRRYKAISGRFHAKPETAKRGVLARQRCGLQSGGIRVLVPRTLRIPSASTTQYSPAR